MIMIKNKNMLKNIIKHKIQTLKKYYFCIKYKDKTINQKQIVIFFENNNQKFDNFLNNLKNKNFIPKLKIDTEKAIISADNAINNSFLILNRKITFNKNINWHQDFSSWKNNFYTDIKYKIYSSDKIENLGPEIKIPWELSRLYHVVDFAIAHEKTNDKKYIDSFILHVENWIDKNPFLLGVNWLNPMEVLIRAINLIHAFDYFKNKKNIPNSFWIKLINSLYQHKIYIENNWEIFYKNNNHYIADLIGYFYLVIFFDSKFEQIKIFKKILKEFDIQIQPDGTCYEGSTNYHKLTTELFLLFYFLCKKNNFILPENFKFRLNKAINFIRNCSDFADKLAQIGDNDGGKILHNFNLFKKQKSIKNIIKQNNKILYYYPNFGLSIIKNNNFFITYRHPTYKQNQPSGHFHNDSLSITLSYNNIPIIIDPGTYVYTPNKFYRDKLRSFNNHSTFFIKDNTFEQDIFKLNKLTQKDTAIIKKNKNKILIKNFYINDNAKLHRALIFDKINNNLIIKDFVKNITKKHIHWNFIFHPNINLKKINRNKFEILHENKTIFILKTNLDFSIQQTFYSQDYGLLEKSLKLTATQKMDNQKIITKLYSTKA